ncbi:MAG: EamA family transporter [Firmicutes bacterium]|nr:EamA family transporter [Bacillota bacterium]
MVLTASVLWGLSGTAAQVLFQDLHLAPGWLTAVRLLLAGAALTLLTLLREGRRGAAVWRHPRDRWRLMAFAAGGMLGVQYAYLAAIAAGNAATATLLQYLAPALLVGGRAVVRRRLPGRREGLAVMLATTGTALLVTGGHWARLALAPAALGWGLASAAALAFYTVYPQPLLQRYGPAATMGWGMLTGSGLLLVVHAPRPLWPHLPPAAWLLTAGVVVLGTLLPFYLYLASRVYLPATDTALLASAEPLAATGAAMAFLGVRLGPAGLAGAGAIIATVLLLAPAPARVAVDGPGTGSL